MTHRSRVTTDQTDPHETQPQPPRPAGEPSWIQYASNQHHLPREELLARYRKSRNLPDDPFAVSAAHEGGPQYRTMVRAQPRPPQRFLEAQNWQRRDEEKAPPPRRKKARAGLSLGQTFAVAAVMAALSGGAVGFLNGQFNSLTGIAAKLFAADEPERAAPLALQPAIAATVAEAASPSSGTGVSKKTVATATLRVSDVTGDTRNPIPLSLLAEPALPGGDLTLKISGVPEQAYLT